MLIAAVTILLVSSCLYITMKDSKKKEVYNVKIIRRLNFKMIAKTLLATFAIIMFHPMPQNIMVKCGFTCINTEQFSGDAAVVASCSAIAD